MSAQSLKFYLPLIQHNPEEKGNVKTASATRRRDYISLQCCFQNPLIFIAREWAGMDTVWF